MGLFKANPIKKAARKEKRAEKKEVRAEKREERGGTRLGVAVKKVGKVVKQIGHTVLKVGENIAFAPIAIFKPMMIKELDRRGIAHTDMLHDIAPKFAKHVTGHHFEYFEEQMFSTGDLKINFSEKNSDGKHLVDVVASSIVKAIVEFFKNLKKKKESGTPMSESETKLLNDSEAVINTVEDIAIETTQDSVVYQIKNFVFSWKGVASLAGIVVILLFLFKKK